MICQEYVYILTCIQIISFAFGNNRFFRDVAFVFPVDCVRIVCKENVEIIVTDLLLQISATMVAARIAY